jgi:hypothetical protein
MNTQKLYALVRAFEDIGLTHDEAYERAFREYCAIKNAQKASAQIVTDLAAAAGVACCDGVEASA